MSERLPRLTPDRLDAAQRALYESIAGGERAKGIQHFPLADEDGSLNGPFGVMLHAPGVGAALQELGGSIRFHTDLSPRVREIAILQVAHATGSTFEWWAHERVGRAVGLTEDEVMQLSLGGFEASDPVESAAAGYCSTLLTSSEVSDAEYEAAAARLTAEQMIDLAVLVGYYRTLAQLMEVFRIGVPGRESAPVGHRHAH